MPSSRSVSIADSLHARACLFLTTNEAKPLLTSSRCPPVSVYPSSPAGCQGPPAFQRSMPRRLNLQSAGILTTVPDGCLGDTTANSTPRASNGLVIHASSSESSPSKASVSDPCRYLCWSSHSPVCRRWNLLCVCVLLRKVQPASNCHCGQWYVLDTPLPRSLPPRHYSILPLDFYRVSTSTLSSASQQ